MMRLPRVRFTVRRMMIAVVVLGVALKGVTWLRRRSLEFEARAQYHSARKVWEFASGKDGVCHQRNDFGEEVSAEEDRWHYTLEQKYLIAARYPWLPVEPDPPEPE
jgi:hypothetical protein